MNSMKRNAGFTLVELLIVIGIIAILSTITLTAINPREIMKKVYDVNKKTEVNNILFALDNYFIDTFEFPWGEAEEEVALEATNPSVGICGGEGETGESGCIFEGELVATGKINSSFIKRKAFRSTASFEDKYFVIGEEGTLPSICYLPESKSIRGEYYNSSADLRVLDFSGDDINSPTTQLCLEVYPEGSSPLWDSLANSCFECIPLKPLETE